MDFAFIKLTAGLLATIGLYTILYRENKFYRLTEHVFVGLAVGYSIVGLWTETLKNMWWDKIMGSQASEGSAVVPGYWPYVLLLPIGLMGYFVFNRKHSWMSRIPIGIILGLVVGQEANAWLNRDLPQIEAAMKPIIPNTGEGFFVPTEPVPGMLYPTQAIGNVIFLITMLTVLSYFLFSFDFKTKFMQKTTLTGRWLLMIGFGAIFGNTVMTRFTLLIDRMYFVWIEWLIQGVFKMG
jgi:hypothetical protein